MAKTLKRSLSLMLTIVMLAGMALCVSAYNDNYPNNHRNSGKHIADLLAVAASQVGYTELDPSTGIPLQPESQVAGYTKYGASFGEPRGEWCAYFVSWCARNAGIPTSIVPRLGNCAASVEWYKKHSVYRPANSGYIPKPGDIVFYNWSGGSIAKHVGIATGVNLSKNVVYTIEGNTGPGRGNQCMSKERSLTAGYIVGYGVPAYNDAGNNYGSQKYPNSGSHSGSSNYAQLTVITTSATEITATNAKLHGEVKNTGRFRISSAGFLFGSDKTKLKKHTVASSTTAINIKLEMDVASTVGELKPNTTYYYRSFVRIDGRDYPGPMYAVVTVNDQPQQLMLSEIATNVGLGQTLRLTATPLPYGTVSKGIVWKSADEKIATVSDSGVVKGISYGDVKLTATTNYGSVSAECTVRVIIPTPENLTLINKSAENITISWDKVEGAEGYVIYRSSDKDSEPSRLTEVGASVTEFADTSVEPGDKYYYRVVAVAPKEEYNSELSQTVCSAARLSCPTGISSAQDNLWIKLTWDSVEDATGYFVYRSTSENGIYTNIGKAYGNIYIDRSVLSGQTFFYKIVADDGNERTRSHFSETASATAPVAPPSDKQIDFIGTSPMNPVIAEQSEAKLVRMRTKDFIPTF